MERPIIPLSYPTPIERFEALYSKKRKEWNDDGLLGDNGNLYLLGREILDGLNISVEDFVKAEWNELHSGKKINPCNIPFSNLFLLREYNDRMFRFIFLDGVAPGQFNELYVGDELVAMAAKMVSGDDDLGEQLLYAVFDHLTAMELKPEDEEKILTVIEKALDIFDGNYNNKDVLSRITAAPGLYSTERGKQIIEKAAKHPSHDVRAWFTGDFG